MTTCALFYSSSREHRKFLQEGSLFVNDQDKTQRTVLPIPDQPRTGLITYDAKDPETKFPPITQLRPPKGAPNVLIILIDDAGFGSSTAFGGPCNTPTAELLAADRKSTRLNSSH